jgi:hypothetical protein
MSERIYYNIYFLGAPIDDVQYSTREEAEAKLATLPGQPPGVALVGEEFTVEEWTPANTYEENESGWIKVHTLEQLAKWGRLATYYSPEEFTEITGVTFDELKGRWFTVSNDRVHFMDEDEKEGWGRD